MRKLLTIIVFLVALTFVFLSEPQNVFNNDEDEENTLSFWGIYDLPEVYEPIIQAFQRENPEVKINYKQFSKAEER